MDQRKLKTGAMIAVVGPSGAGKDSVMSFAARHFADDPSVHFVRRMITRAADAGSEDHNALTEAEFERQRLAGAFAVSWDAHGLKYGIPASTLDRIAEGDIVIANGSRAALPAFQAAYSRLIIINITASPDVLAGRLASRGRETEEEIRARLQRPAPVFADGLDVRTIDNSGKLEDAAVDFIAVVKHLQ